MNKSTPEPLAYDLRDGQILEIKSADIVVLGGCGCCGSPWCSEGDAQLIASAPDLLEALKDLLSQVQGFQECNGDKGIVLADAIAAIEKATS